MSKSPRPEDASKPQRKSSLPHSPRIKEGATFSFARPDDKMFFMNKKIEGDKRSEEIEGFRKKNKEFNYISLKDLLVEFNDEFVEEVISAENLVEITYTMKSNPSNKAGYNQFIPLLDADSTGISNISISLNKNKLKEVIDKQIKKKINSLNVTKEIKEYLAKNVQNIYSGILTILKDELDNDQKLSQNHIIIQTKDKVQSFTSSVKNKILEAYSKLEVPTKKTQKSLNLNDIKEEITPILEIINRVESNQIVNFENLTYAEQNPALYPKKSTILTKKQAQQVLARNLEENNQSPQDSIIRKDVKNILIKRANKHKPILEQESENKESESYKKEMKFAQYLQESVGIVDDPKYKKTSSLRNALEGRLEKMDLSKRDKDVIARLLSDLNLSSQQNNAFTLIEEMFEEIAQNGSAVFKRAKPIISFDTGQGKSFLVDNILTKYADIVQRFKNEGTIEKRIADLIDSGEILVGEVFSTQVEALIEELRNNKTHSNALRITNFLEEYHGNYDKFLKQYFLHKNGFEIVKINLANKGELENLAKNKSRCENKVIIIDEVFFIEGASELMRKIVDNGGKIIRVGASANYFKTLEDTYQKTDKDALSKKLAVLNSELKAVVEVEGTKIFTTESINNIRKKITSKIANIEGIIGDDNSASIDRQNYNLAKAKKRIAETNLKEIQNRRISTKDILERDKTEISKYDDNSIEIFYKAKIKEQVSESRVQYLLPGVKFLETEVAPLITEISQTNRDHFIVINYIKNQKHFVAYIKPRSLKVEHALANSPEFKEAIKDKDKLNGEVYEKAIMVYAGDKEFVVGGDFEHLSILKKGDRQEIFLQDSTKDEDQRNIDLLKQMFGRDRGSETENITRKLYSSGYATENVFKFPNQKTQFAKECIENSLRLDAQNLIINLKAKIDANIKSLLSLETEGNKSLISKGFIEGIRKKIGGLEYLKFNKTENEATSASFHPQFPITLNEEDFEVTKDSQGNYQYQYNGNLNYSLDSLFNYPFNPQILNSQKNSTNSIIYDEKKAKLLYEINRDVKSYFLYESLISSNSKIVIANKALIATNPQDYGLTKEDIQCLSEEKTLDLNYVSKLAKIVHAEKNIFVRQKEAVEKMGEKLVEQKKQEDEKIVFAQKQKEMEAELDRLMEKLSEFVQKVAGEYETKKDSNTTSETYKKRAEVVLDFQDKVKELSGKLEESRQNLDQREEALKNIGQLLQELTDIILGFEQVVTENSAYEEEIKGLRDEIDKLKDVNKKSSGANISLLGELRTNKEEIDKLKATILAVTKEKDELQAKITQKEQFDSKLSGEKKALESKISGFEKQIIILLMKLENLESENSKLKKDLEKEKLSYSEDLKNKKQKFEELFREEKDRHDQALAEKEVRHQVEKNALNKEISDKEREFNELMEAQKALSIERHENEEKLKKLLDDIKEVYEIEEKILQNPEKLKEVLKAKKEEFQDQINDLTGNNSKKDEEIKRLSNQIENLETVGGDLSQVQVRNEELQQAIILLQVEQAENREEIDRLKTELESNEESYKAEIDQLKSDHEKEITRLNAELKSNKESYEAGISQLKSTAEREKKKAVDDQKELHHKADLEVQEVYLQKSTELLEKNKKLEERLSEASEGLEMAKEELESTRRKLTNEELSTQEKESLSQRITGLKAKVAKSNEDVSVLEKEKTELERVLQNTNEENQATQQVLKDQLSEAQNENKALKEGMSQLQYNIQNAVDSVEDSLEEKMREAMLRSNVLKNRDKEPFDSRDEEKMWFNDKKILRVLKKLENLGKIEEFIEIFNIGVVNKALENDYTDWGGYKYKREDKLSSDYNLTVADISILDNLDNVKRKGGISGDSEIYNRKNLEKLLEMFVENKQEILKEDFFANKTNKNQYDLREKDLQFSFSDGVKKILPDSPGTSVKDFEVIRVLTVRDIVSEK